MSPEAQRIAIAEACPGIFRIAKESGDVIWIRDGHEEDCDPINDLNVMREVEQVGIKNDHQADTYIRWLHVLSGSEFPYESMPLIKQRGVIRAQARQRAEAFLKTLGLWKP